MSKLPTNVWYSVCADLCDLFPNHLLLLRLPSTSPMDISLCSEYFVFWNQTIVRHFRTQTVLLIRGHPSSQNNTIPVYQMLRSRFLGNYQDTPHCTTNVVSAECMFQKHWRWWRYQINKCKQQSSDTQYSPDNLNKANSQHRLNVNLMQLLAKRDQCICFR